MRLVLGRGQHPAPARGVRQRPDAVTTPNPSPSPRLPTGDVPWSPCTCDARSTASTHSSGTRSPARPGDSLAAFEAEAPATPSSSTRAPTSRCDPFAVQRGPASVSLQVSRISGSPENPSHVLSRMPGARVNCWACRAVPVDGETRAEAQRYSAMDDLVVPAAGQAAHAPEASQCGARPSCRRRKLMFGSQPLSTFSPLGSEGASGFTRIGVPQRAGAVPLAAPGSRRRSLR